MGSMDDYIESLGASKEPLGLRTQSAWRLRFTEGLIVLLPMPDFSMTFNVIALSSTAVTFFFGSIFRLTGAGHIPHWVLKKDDEPKKGAFSFLRSDCCSLHSWAVLMFWLPWKYQKS